MMQLNLAVDRIQFPSLKKSFNLAGKRKFLYIGNDHPGKNIPYLREIASRLGTYEFAWAGKGTSSSGLKSLGYVDFSSPEGRKLVSNYDFMITVGNADANPTTILEALSWGLIPVCTPTSGYQDEMGIVNIPHDDVNRACLIIEELQAMDSEKLSIISSSGDKILTEKYNWSNFFKVVLNSINTDFSPQLDIRKFDDHSYQSAYGHKILAKLFVNNFLDLLGRR
jgi:hypothetical protein